jgi:hypothetical protein
MIKARFINLWNSFSETTNNQAHCFSVHDITNSTFFFLLGLLSSNDSNQKRSFQEVSTPVLIKVVFCQSFLSH